MFLDGETVFQNLSKLTPEQRKREYYSSAWSEDDMANAIKSRLEDDDVTDEEKAELNRMLKCPDVMAAIVHDLCDQCTDNSDPTVEDINNEIADYVQNILEHARNGDHDVSDDNDDAEAPEE